MYDSQNNFQSDEQVNTNSSFVSSISKSMLNNFQYSLQSKLQTLQSFQSQLQDKKEITLDKFEAQKQQLQVLIVEIASFLDDLMLPIIEENPFFVEDFLIFMKDFMQKLETQFALFTTLSVSSLRDKVRKQVAQTSQNFETKALKESFEEKQKQTLAQTELLLETLNEQLIDIRHRIEKQKDKFLNNSTTLTFSTLSLPSVSSSELVTLSEKTISTFELIKQDVKRFFM
ncbi:hypothetical protein V9L05_03255 [Bernardetia sp. Wsw4-3y2]|uniref:hypothetical protein n=1 Tax=Bernardetia sp. Wsw4-3y2 TaxID=3127471 RepID=UPI0030D5C1AE